MTQRNLIKSVNNICQYIQKWQDELQLIPKWDSIWKNAQQAQQFRLELSSYSFKIHQALNSFKQQSYRATSTHQEKPNAVRLAAKWTEKQFKSIINNDEDYEKSQRDDPAKQFADQAQAQTLLLKLEHSFQILCQTENNIRKVLLDLPVAEYQIEQIKEEIENLNQTLINNNRDTHLSDYEETRRTFELVHQSRFLKRLCANIDGQSGTYQADLISETFSMSEVQWYQLALKESQLDKDYEEVYTGSLEREVSSFEEAVQAFVSQSQDPQFQPLQVMSKIWRCLLWGGELEVTIHVSPIAESDSLVQRCVNARKNLRLVIESSVSDIDDQSFIECFTELSWDLLYYASDLMSEMDHTSLKCSIFRLSCVTRDLDWYLSWGKVNQSLKSSEQNFVSSIKRLQKQLHRVQVELQEKQLQERLESIFGQKFITRFEQLLFVLIFVVLALLFYEFIWVDHDDKGTRKVLALIDTGICAVFLTEFLLKLSLVKQKWFYFKRRWFIDLLPSIPFVYFTDYLYIEYMMAGRSAKLVRLSRFARYIRIIRPFIRVIRLISFTLRGMDRLIRRYSQWLNHNLVFFEPSQSIYHRPEQSYFDQANVVYARSLALSRQLTAQLTTNELAPMLPFYLKSLKEHLSGEHAPLSQQQLDGEMNAQRLKEVPVEHAIHTLINLQGAELEAHLGYNFPKRLYTVVGLFDLPIVNRLPLLKIILLKRRHSTASEFAAWWIRGFGKFLETLLSLGYWFADLYGVVTGPKLIDRVGSTLVRSFERPAKRLMIFGGLLITLKLMVTGLGVNILSNLVNALQRFVGLPMIIIGTICLVPLLLGKWMKRIADQAEELYRLTSEAQFINLLKDLKERNAEEDLTQIYNRVVYAEEQLWGLVEAETKEKRCKTFVQVSAQDLKKPLLVDHETEESKQVSHSQPLNTDSQNDEFLELCEAMSSPNHDLYWLDKRLDLLYRDYLDGAILHHSDIKTTEQLLGNLSLRNLFDYKLSMTNQEKSAIERLDLGTHRSLIGPFMWFSLITQSVSQAAAQLVIDYNRYVIPKNQIDLASPGKLSLFEAWIQHKRGQGLSYPELEKRKRELQRSPFNTTDITVLQILASPTNHEEEIKSRFGEEVLAILNNDQKRLIRGVFSSYPLHQLPKPMRTLNPYLLYNEFIQGGKVFILPFRLIGLVFKTIALALSWTKEKIDEIRFPEKIRTEIIPQKDFVVAQRKIDRMRKPIFMKLLQLRAQIDFAYLGLHVEGLKPLNAVDEIPYALQDLELINAIEVERLPIIEQIESTQSSLREFYEYLVICGYTGQELKSKLARDYQVLSMRSPEVLRALVTAYLSDFKDIQSYLQTKIKLGELFNDSLNGLPNQPFKLHRRVLLSAGRATKRIVHRGQDREMIGFKMFWDKLGFSNEDEVSFKICWERYLQEARDLQDLLVHFAGTGLPSEHDIFDEIIRNTSMWSDELVTLRSVQTFSLMDIENYRRYIWSVGSYAEDLTQAKVPSAPAQSMQA